VAVTPGPGFGEEGMVVVVVTTVVTGCGRVEVVVLDAIVEMVVEVVGGFVAGVGSDVTPWR
jgi:hypothetical protein